MWTSLLYRNFIGVALHLSFAMANLAQDILVQVINQKLIERRSVLRVDERFTFVKLCQLSSLTAEEIEITILTDAGLPTVGVARHVGAPAPFPVLQIHNMYQLPYPPPPAPAPVAHFVDAPLEKAISYNGSQRKTTVQMAELLGDIMTTPRQHWTHLQKQVVAMSFAGVAEVSVVQGEDEINRNWQQFSHQFRSLAHEDAEFFHAIDPVVVLVDLFGGGLHTMSSPENYFEFMQRLLSPAGSTLTSVEEAPRKGFEWPSGTAPANFANSCTIFVCNTGTFENMVADAQMLAKIIKKEFSTVGVYRVDTAGVPAEL